MTGSPSGAGGGEHAGQRRHFAAGDFVTRFPAGAPVPLRIDSPHPKAGWQPRQTGSYTSTEHAGTPVFFEGHPWEVVRCEASSDRFVYYLSPWDDRFPLRTPVEYSVATCERDAQERLRREAKSGLGWALTILAPVVALIPAADQRRLENEVGFPAARASLASAILVWLASFVVFVIGLAVSFAGKPAPGLEWVPPLFPFAVYLVLESMVRFFSSFRMGDPMGSLPVCLPIELVRALRHAFAPEARREAARERAVARRTGSTADRYANARDDVRRLDAQGAELEITSLLPKEDWLLERTGIYLGQTCYYLAERAVHDGPDGPRYVFRLRLADEEMFFNSACNYTPEEVQGRMRERRRQQRATWVQTVAPLWGLLDPPLKLELGELYELDTGNITAWSIGGELVCGAAALYASLSYLSSEQARFVDAAVFFAGLFLLVEGIGRYLQLRRGRPIGSLLGRALEPLARSLLR